MKRSYTTANGKQVNIDAIIAQNEETIAVGNMKVNARGDQLGPGGVVEIPKSKMMADYYKLNTPVAVDVPLESHRKEKKKMLDDEWEEPIVEVVQSSQDIEQENKSVLRGSLADSVSKNKIADKQEPNKTGPSRI